MKENLWKKQGVPHKDWTFLRMEENEDMETCEMCGEREIRYVHIMAHDRYPDVLRCGCVCAGKMMCDSSRATANEAAYKRWSSARARFPNLTGWRPGRQKNGRLKVEIKKGGHKITVYLGYRNTWAFSVDQHMSDWIYKSDVDAMLAAYDHIWTP